jgi:hypothetical protein
MNQTVVIVAGGVALVGGVILYRRFQAAKTSPAPDKCAAFAGIVGDVAGTAAGPADLSANSSAQQAAYLACKLASSIPWDKIKSFVGLDSKGCLDYHAQNEKLNGPAKETIHPQFAAFLETERIGSQPWICTKPGVMRYQNGCEPYPDEDGKMRPGCAPGTHSLTKQRGDRGASIGSGRPYNPLTRVGDPTTRKHTAAMGQFPLTVKQGEVGWWVRGAPVVCSANATIAKDHRGEERLVCWPSSTAPEPRRDSSNWWDLFGLDGRSGGAQVPGTTTITDDKTTTDHR